VRQPDTINAVKRHARTQEALKLTFASFAATLIASFPILNFQAGLRCLSLALPAGEQGGLAAVSVEGLPGLSDASIWTTSSINRPHHSAIMG
jgi:hypothetical protein